ETLAGSPLATAELVVARVDRDAQQPAAETRGGAAKRLEATKCAEKGFFRGVKRVFGIAQRALAHVVDLALLDLDQAVEGGHLAALGGAQGGLERARVGLHMR